MKSSPDSSSPRSGDRLARYIGWACAGIIALLPFHAFFTVWGSSLFGYYTELRLWKEILLALLVIGAIVVGVRQRRDWSAARKLFGPTRLCTVAKAYGLLLVVAGLLAYWSGGVSLKAFAYGLLLDLRFLVFFGVVWLVTVHGGGFITRYWRQLLLIPAAVVMVFGLVQFAVLPPEFLGHFGYGPSTIDAIQTIDQKEAYQRVQSTLRGANPLGAYLVMVIAAFAVLLLPRARSNESDNPAMPGRYTAGFALSCLVLVLTFSRSAWLGALAALAWLLYQALRPARLRRGLAIAAAVALITFAGVGFLLRDNDVFQNTVFHTDEHSQAAESSNAGHFAATAAGLGDLVRQPLGSGTGTAGPASVYNEVAPPQIAENYFVQVGQETGILGLGLFVAVIILVGRELWRRRDSPLALLLLASLIGITIINMLSHAWTDDTLAYIWWGLAGAAMSLPAVGVAQAAATKAKRAGHET